MVTAAALLAPSVMGATGDFKVKKHAKGNCSGSGGPERTYSENVCNPRYESDHGLEVLDHTAGCKSKYHLRSGLFAPNLSLTNGTVRMYKGGNCEGGVVSAVSSLQCHGIPSNAWSFRVECP